MSSSDQQTIPRATGLLIIEVRNSNPNGDPDQESDPRRRSHDQRGLITGVSFKRKLRDLVLNKDGEVWKQVGKALPEEQFDILESRQHRRADIEKLLKQDFDGFKRRFWDGRVFGNTFLEEGGGDTIRSGVVHFGLGVSIAPVRVERLTMTKVAPAQSGAEGEEGPTRGMAPLGYRVVEHGVYGMPFFVNPTAAVGQRGTGCQPRDIALLLKLIPYAYAHTPSHIRPHVEVRHAWYAQHEDDLGSFSEFEFLDVLKPKRKGAPEQPSTDQLPLDEQYDVPRDVPENLRARLKGEALYDVCVDLPNWCKSD
jgi:CRISPR-associated protein Csd2